MWEFQEKEGEKMIHRANTKVGIEAELSWEINKNVHFVSTPLT